MTGDELDRLLDEIARLYEEWLWDVRLRRRVRVIWPALATHLDDVCAALEGTD